MSTTPFAQLRSAIIRNLTITVVVILFAALGVYLLTVGHAATPYIKLNADGGKLSANCATVQANSQASDGSYVQFDSPNCSGAGNNGGGGGKGTFAFIGMGAGWVPHGVSDVSSAVKYVRYTDGNGQNVSYWLKNNDGSASGIKIDFLYHGGYPINGHPTIQNRDPSTEANSILAEYKQYGCNPTICPWVEVYNEPGGSWFWGSGATSTANESKYDDIIIATYNKFHDTTANGGYGSGAPKILASYDGGSDSSLTWGEGMWKANPQVKNYIDGITIHPYGGTDSQTASAQGNRNDVTQAYTETGIPVYITEIGWPTGSGPTSDSLAWSLYDQCNNVFNFMTWAEKTPGVAGVFYYGYINADDKSPAQYGLLTHDNGNQHKPAYYALQAAAQGKTSYSCGSSLSP